MIRPCVHKVACAAWFPGNVDAPVFYGLEADIEEISGVPTELSRMLLAGELDAARLHDATVEQDVHHVGLYFIEEALVVGDEHDAEIQIGRAHV